MKLTTIALATAFALSTSLAFAQAGRNDAGATAPEHTAKHHSHKKHMARRQSGPGLEPGAPDASRPGAKGVSKKPAEPRLPSLPSIPG